MRDGVRMKSIHALCVGLNMMDCCGKTKQKAMQIAMLLFLCFCLMQKILHKCSERVQSKNTMRYTMVYICSGEMTHYNDVGK